MEDIFIRNNCIPDNKYNYDIASPQHKNGIIEVFTEAFCGAEPMTKYLNMQPDKFKIFATAVTENAIRDQLSIVALDKNKVIACALMEDLAAPRDVPINFDENFKYIISLLEQLSGDFFKDKKLDEKMVAHLFITAVAKNYRQRRISTQVNFHAMNIVSKHGFKFVYSELTNVFNERGIFNYMIENKKKLLCACDYKNFEIEGFKPFPTLEGYAHGYLWEIHEGAEFSQCFFSSGEIVRYSNRNA